MPAATTQTTTIVLSTTHATEQSGSTTPIDQPVSRPHSSIHGVSTNLDFETASKVPVETTSVKSGPPTTVTSKPETVTTTIAPATLANTEAPKVDEKLSTESVKSDTTAAATTAASPETTTTPKTVESPHVEPEIEVTTVSATTVTVPIITVAVTEPSIDVKPEKGSSDENVKRDTTVTTPSTRTTTVSTSSEPTSDSKGEDNLNVLTEKESTTTTSTKPPTVNDVDDSKSHPSTTSTTLAPIATTDAENKPDQHQDESTTTPKVEENKNVDNSMPDPTTPSTTLVSTVTMEVENKPDQHPIDATTVKPESGGTVIESVTTSKPTDAPTQTPTETKVEDNNDIEKAESSNELTTIVSTTSSTINNAVIVPNSGSNNELNPHDQSESQQTTTTKPETKPIDSNEEEKPSNSYAPTEVQHSDAVSTSTEANNNMTQSTSNIFDEIGNLCNKTKQESADKMEPTAIVIDVTAPPNEMILSTIASTDKVTENQNNDNIPNATQSTSNILDEIANSCNKSQESAEMQHKDDTTENAHEIVAVTSITVESKKPETVPEMSNPTAQPNTNDILTGKENELVTSAIDETTTIDPENASIIYRSSISLVVPLLTVLLFSSNVH